MCKIVGKEGTASLVVIPALVLKVSQENERGLEKSPPPSGLSFQFYLFEKVFNSWKIENNANMSM